jgi:phosphoenolpyruvate phosphomutase
MKAIILNSGVGKRMGAYSRQNPKCLIEIMENETILSRQIQLLTRNGIDEVIMTTGPFEEKIKRYLNINFPKVDILLINNPKYSITNYIYSIYLIPRELINENIILMHGDMVFEDDILKNVINSLYHNCVLVNKKIQVPNKDFKGKIEDGKVKEIGVDLFGPNCFLLMPLYKLSKNSFLKWMDEIENFINEGKTTVYAENALNMISDELIISPLYFEDELCMEIDTVEDLRLAKTLLGKRT